MDFIKAKEILSVIEGLDHNSTNAIFEALKLAQHVEQSSKDFYEAEAEKTKGTELESFFVFLVKEEKMHLEKILELQKLIKADNLKSVSFPKNAAPSIHAIPAGQSELSAILYGLWREKKAVEFYSSAAERTTGAVKKFFEELADFERVHVSLFEGIMDSMQNVEELIMG